IELGKKDLPDLTFDVVSPDGSGTYLAKGVPVEIQGTLPAQAVEKGEELFDIRPPADVPVRSYRMLYWLAGALALLALGFFAFRAWRRPKTAVVAPPKPKEPIEVRARLALDALRAMDLPGNRQFREFHFRLSEILRGYLGERYAFDALECTSTELLDLLRRLRTPGLKLD